MAKTLFELMVEKLTANPESCSLDGMMEVILSGNREPLDFDYNKYETTVNQVCAAHVYVKGGAA
jgi:hypothetical protein